MGYSMTTHAPAGRRALALAACLGLAPIGTASAEDGSLRVRGVFCNSEDQIDGALSHMGRGLPARTAVELMNEGGVFCTYVDLLDYVVHQPVRIGANTYRAMLTGVVAGGELRAVSPPVEVFFVTPAPLAGAVSESRA